MSEIGGAKEALYPTKEENLQGKLKDGKPITILTFRDRLRGNISGWLGEYVPETPEARKGLRGETG